MENHTILKIENLTKRFTGVVAVNDVSLDIFENEIHAIIGENGAGKSTLCKLLTGAYSPNEGTIELFGEQVKFNHIIESRKAGIGMVYQERNLVGMLTGAENICLGNEPKSKIFINKKKIVEDANAICKRMGFDIPLDVPVQKLGAGVQQIIEILRTFYLNPRLLILDEPTASLGQGEVGPFLDEIRRIRKETGVSVIFISHKIEEVFQIADRITVMRDGEKALTVRTEESSMDECIAAMVRDRQLDPIVIKGQVTKEPDKILEVEKLHYDGSTHDLNLNIHSGEVIGFYGLVGSGRTESMEALYGIRHADERHFTFNGEPINKENPLAMINKGMVMTPENRSSGEFFGLPLIDNICNLFLEKLSRKLGILKFKEMFNFTDYVLKKNRVKHTSINQSISDLSGGNKQKIIIGRSIEVEKLKLLILDEPTAGLDLGAKHEIYLQIRSLADDDNKAVIFISSELEELIATCDRIYVYANGNVVKEFPRKDFVKQEILSAALKGNGNLHKEKASQIDAPDEQAAISEKSKKTKLKKSFLEYFPKYFLLIATVLFTVVFYILEPKFLSKDNIFTIVNVAALTGTLAIGMILCLIVGEINFAIGAQATVAAAAIGWMMAGRGVPYPVAILACLVFPILLGFLAIKVKINLGVPTFMATMCVAPFGDGLTKIFTGNTVFFSYEWLETPFLVIGQKMIGPVPLLSIAYFIILLLCWLLLDHTCLGRYMFSVGASLTASTQVGIKVSRIKVFGFLLGAVVVGIGGIMIASREGKIWPTMGAERMFDAIAVAMLSATVFRPGQYNIPGILLGSVFLTIIFNGVRMIGAPLEIRYLVQGVAFLVATGIIAQTRKGQGGLPGVKFGR